MHQSTQHYTLLKDIRPVMRKLDIEVIVLQQENETVVTRDGKYIYWYLVADKSGVMVLKAWGPSGGMIKAGDILHVSGIENKMVADRHLLEISRQGKIQRLGQDTFPFTESPNFSQSPELPQGRQPSTKIGPQTSLPLDNEPTSVITNFGPGWMGGLRKNHQHYGGDERVLPSPNMEQQRNHCTNQLPKVISHRNNNNKENATMN